jgi:hypothetical protein
MVSTESNEYLQLSSDVMMAMVHPEFSSPLDISNFYYIPYIVNPAC